MRDRDYISDNRKADRGRFWCAYTELEEYHAGMWRQVSGETRQTSMVARAVMILRDPDRFSVALERVIAEWPTSCLAEFTSPGNHLAWLGQAACCISESIPESLTRRAWWKLSDDERNRANAVAKAAISKWRMQCRSGFGATTKNLKSITQACGGGYLATKSGPGWSQCLLPF